MERLHSLLLSFPTSAAAPVPFYARADDESHA
jgi:hypothetical protein